MTFIANNFYVMPLTFYFFLRANEILELEIAVLEIKSIIYNSKIWLW